MWCCECMLMKLIDVSYGHRESAIGDYANYPIVE